jgi:hypothetical protein
MMPCELYRKASHAAAAMRTLLKDAIRKRMGLGHGIGDACLLTVAPSR